MLAYSHHPSHIAAWPLVITVTALAAWLVPDSILTRSGQAEAAETVKPLIPNPPVLNQAKQLIEKGDHESAATVLRRFLTTNPRPEHLDDTYLLLGAALYGMQDYGEALRYLNQLHTEFPESELIDRSKLFLARTHAAMGNVDLAMPLLTQVRTTTLDAVTKREAQHLTAEVLAQKKDYVRAIHILLEGMTGSSEDQVKETRAQIRQFVAEKLDKKG